MIRPPLATTVASLMGVLVINPAFAGPAVQGSVRTTSYSSRVEDVATREEARRADRSEHIGREAIALGDRAMADKDYEKAYAQYKAACDNIPNAPKSDGLYKRALRGLCDAAIRLAEQRITEGRYADAELTLKSITEHYDPQCKGAFVILRNLETPGYYNKTITPKFRANVEEVKRLILDAQGYYDSGRYDLAFKNCEKVLNLDPYNIAARKMEEKINFARDNYADAAYNEARSRAMWRVNKGWENPVRRFGLKDGGVIVQPVNVNEGTTRIEQKLARIIIPRLEFREATIREAVDYLKKKSIELDTQETDKDRRGVNIVLKLEGAGAMGALPVADAPAGIPGIADALPGAAPAAPAIAPLASPADARITISLTNVPMKVALDYVTQLANLKYKIEPFAVSIVPQGTPTDILQSKEFKVRPGFIGSRTAVAGGDNALLPAGPADATKGSGSSIAGRLDAKEFLISQGIPFPPGASATYLAGSSRLVIRNTQENLELLEILIAAGNGEQLAAQVEIESKFVEITQSNLKELSFDWLLGQFNVGKGGVFAGGGTAGTSAAVSGSDFPFVAPGGSPIGTTPITAGNRSGSAALTASAIDALLFGTAGASRLAPGIAAISGVFTDPQFQVVIRALNQKKGVDLLSAPRVTTKSGQKAVIEIIREFRYPTEFDPPQIPQNFGNQSSGISLVPTLSAPPSSFPVTPTTPTQFEVRNTGVTLEVDPVIGPDGYTIDLNLVPQVVEFEGFINYGSPIQTTSTNVLGVSTTNIITPNVINQPIFSTRKVSTSVTIFDGQTVVLGGLMREDVQKVEDKVPLLGDIPFVGRLFRSSVDQHLKRNLVIFVSARLINPAGEPVHLEEDTEEIVETVSLPEVAVPELLPLMPK